MLILQLLMATASVAIAPTVAYSMERCKM